MSQPETGANHTSTSVDVGQDVRRSDRPPPSLLSSDTSLSSPKTDVSTSPYPSTTKLPPIASISGISDHGARYGRQSYNWDSPTLPPPSRRPLAPTRPEEETTGPPPYDPTGRGSDRGRVRGPSFGENSHPPRLQMPPLPQSQAQPLTLPEPSNSATLSPQARRVDFPSSAGHSRGQSTSSQATPIQAPESLTPSNPDPPVSERISRTSPRSKPATQYSLLTMQGEGGPVAYHVPIDVQAASKAADAKRKRNAGASARFRARRKEKEQASTKEIDALKQQIQDLGDEVDFYRSERDNLVSILFQSPDWAKHFPRPHSPRHRRRSVHSTSDLTTQESPVQSNFPAYQEYGDHNTTGRYTRRRLESDVTPGSQTPAAVHSADEAMVASPQAGYARPLSDESQRQTQPEAPPKRAYGPIGSPPPRQTSD